MTKAVIHPTGPAVAAFLAAGVGLLALGLVTLLAELNEGIEEAVFSLGKAWIPGAQGIGPYSGKQTVFLLAWLGSWLALHFTLRRRNPDVRRAFGLCLVLVLVAGALVWPPTWRALGA